MRQITKALQSSGMIDIVIDEAGNVVDATIPPVVEFQLRHAHRPERPPMEVPACDEGRGPRALRQDPDPGSLRRGYSVRALLRLPRGPFRADLEPTIPVLHAATHREALSNLEYGLSVAKPVTVLIGEAGTGKSTLLRAALASEMCRHVTCVFIDNPMLTRAEFFETLASRFDVGENAQSSKATLLGRIEWIVRSRQSRREITALVVDEAQALPDEILEEIRLLANLETPTSKLLPVVLAGQPELATRLNDPRLRQLKQRIALRCELKPLDLPDTAAYIASRIRTAGGDPANIFTREAVTVIHEFSHGLPRTISVMCDKRAGCPGCARSTAGGRRYRARGVP